MKTNHKRGFKAKSHRSNAAWHETRIVPLVDKKLHANVTKALANGRRSEAKSKRGAKKFLNSRTRFNQDAATRKLAAAEPE